jgi:hypothetical protein
MTVGLQLAALQRHMTAARGVLALQLAVLQHVVCGNVALWLAVLQRYGAEARDAPDPTLQCAEAILGFF